MSAAPPYWSWVEGRMNGGQSASDPPWVTPPKGHQPFDFFGVIDTPVAPTAQTTVLTFVVPAGWFGVIQDLTHFVEGGFFQQGSGELIWRLQLDQEYVQNYGNILVSFGDMSSPRSVYAIVLEPRQRVTYSIENVSFAAGGTRSICGCRGWFWPSITR